MRRRARSVVVVAALLLLYGCGASAPEAASIRAGIVLLSLRDGSLVGARELGDDPVAVAVTADGRTAFVSDNRGGVVRAVSLPSMRVLWETPIGGRPGPILVTFDSLLVSLYEANTVVEFGFDGAVRSRHPVGRGPGQLALAGNRILVACADGRVWDLDGHWVPAGAGFGLAGGPGGTWSADYDSGALVRVEDGRRVPLPAHLHPFWLATGLDGSLLVAAEGDDEDRDPGALLAVGDGLVPAILGRARDVDAVAVSGTRTFAAAHADQRVLVHPAAGGPLYGFGPKGLAVVALAPDPAAGLLVVAVNAGE